MGIIAQFAKFLFRFVHIGRITKTVHGIRLTLVEAFSQIMQQIPENFGIDPSVDKPKNGTVAGSVVTKSNFRNLEAIECVV